MAGLYDSAYVRFTLCVPTVKFGEMRTLVGSIFLLFFRSKFVAISPLGVGHRFDNSHLAKKLAVCSKMPQYSHSMVQNPIRSQ